MKENQFQEGWGRDLFTVKNVLIILFGFVLGYFLKIQALETLTIGYDDYKIKTWNKYFTNIDKKAEGVKVETTSQKKASLIDKNKQ
jgi:hypothetical protein